MTSLLDRLMVTPKVQPATEEDTDIFPELVIFEDHDQPTITEPSGTETEKSEKVSRIDVHDQMDLQSDNEQELRSKLLPEENLETETQMTIESSVEIISPSTLDLPPSDPTVNTFGKRRTRNRTRSMSKKNKEKADVGNQTQRNVTFTQDTKVESNHEKAIKTVEKHILAEMAARNVQTTHPNKIQMEIDQDDDRKEYEAICHSMQLKANDYGHLQANDYGLYERVSAEFWDQGEVELIPLTPVKPKVFGKITPSMVFGKPIIPVIFTQASEEKNISTPIPSKEHDYPFPKNISPLRKVKPQLDIGMDISKETEWTKGETKVEPDQPYWLPQPNHMTLIPFNMSQVSKHLLRKSQGELLESNYMLNYHLNNQDRFMQAIIMAAQCEIEQLKCSVESNTAQMFKLIEDDGILRINIQQLDQENSAMQEYVNQERIINSQLRYQVQEQLKTINSLQLENNRVRSYKQQPTADCIAANLKNLQRQNQIHQNCSNPWTLIPGSNGDYVLKNGCGVPG